MYRTAAAFYFRLATFRSRRRSPPMFRFTIRDLMLLTAFTALGLFAALVARQFIGVAALFGAVFLLPCIGIGFLLDRLRGVVRGAWIGQALFWLTLGLIQVFWMGV